ncbi:16S rRNA (adenine(1518)-N(6)/adenine(1519)-N(6))-dimethyltransferase RsmA [Candidatus Amarobacter glycogenicus]|uniref:16S rRNA (adenine(1518)-N(6)/adenine(1519)-N(6))- dimethyltransferase RsmA n=1 Tax=Candidatus Amarobacter glycogenicus TaxID=3140699 RepID=UPI00313510EC|nr:ribosomal RNA small subunit methyltransferase A [Dehalococcoidia bacterium]
MPRTRLPGPRPRKSLGQHFLRDTGILQDIAAAVRCPERGVVLEIGPGTGQLTEYLLAKGCHVVALEIEDRMIAHLERRFAGDPRLRVVPGDARLFDPAEVIPPGMPFAVAGNLPYFAANPIIRHLLESFPKPVEMVVMVQREVAREIAAAEGDWSLLTISVRVYAETELLFDVAPEAFDPPPSVVSSVIRITLRSEPLVPPERNAEFFEFVSRVFRNPRKQIHNGLSRGVWLPPEGARAALEMAGIAPSRRPETLTISEWLRLMDACIEVRVDG